jgi:hypothetical protein
MLLRASDAMSMACSGLELRVRFMYYQLVEIYLRMPQRFQRPGKALSLQSCADLFPPTYLYHSKQDLALLMAAWMRGQLLDLYRSRLASLYQSGWLNAAWISQQWQVFEAGQFGWPRAWSLVVLGEFAHRERMP